VRLDVGSTKNGGGREFAYKELPEVKSLIDRQGAIGLINDNAESTKASA
jgi:hypothetical protein